MDAAWSARSPRRDQPWMRWSPCARRGPDSVAVELGAGGGRRGGDRVGVPGGRVRRIGRLAARPSRSRARAGPMPVVQAQQAEPGDLVGAVVEEPQAGEEVLDVRGSRNFSPPYLTNGIAPRGQLDLEQVAVVGGAHQDRLVAQPRAGLHVRRARGRRPRGLRPARRSSAPAAGAAAGRADRVISRTLQAQSTVGWPDDVREVEQGLPGAEVALQPHDRHTGQRCWSGRSGGRRRRRGIRRSPGRRRRPRSGPVPPGRSARRCRPGPG